MSSTRSSHRQSTSTILGTNQNPHLHIVQRVLQRWHARLDLLNRASRRARAGSNAATAAAAAAAPAATIAPTAGEGRRGGMHHPAQWQGIIVFGIWRYNPPGVDDGNRSRCRSGFSLSTLELGVWGGCGVLGDGRTRAGPGGRGRGEREDALLLYVGCGSEKRRGTRAGVPLCL